MAPGGEQTGHHPALGLAERAWRAGLCAFACLPVSGRSQAGEALRTSLVAQTVKRLPTMQDTRVQCLGQEDPLEKEMAIHSSILVWRIPWTEEPGGLQSTASQSVKTRLSDFTFTWKRTEGRLWVTPSPSDRQEPLATPGHVHLACIPRHNRIRKEARTLKSQPRGKCARKALCRVPGCGYGCGLLLCSLQELTPHPERAETREVAAPKKRVLTKSWLNPGLSVCFPENETALWWASLGPQGTREMTEPPAHAQRLTPRPTIRKLPRRPPSL